MVESSDLWEPIIEYIATMSDLYNSQSIYSLSADVAGRFSCRHGCLVNSTRVSDSGPRKGRVNSLGFSVRKVTELTFEEKIHRTSTRELIKSFKRKL